MAERQQAQHMAEAMTGIGIDLDHGDNIPITGSTKDSTCLVLPRDRYRAALARLIPEFPDVKFFLCGNADNFAAVRTGLADIFSDCNNIAYVPSTSDYSHTHGILKKGIPGTSLFLLASCFNEGTVQAVFSIADTSKIGIEMLRLGRITIPLGKVKPALLAHMPSIEGTYVLADAGASPPVSRAGQYSLAIDEMARTVYSHGVMAAAYAINALGITKPRIGILANGTEFHKGTELTARVERLFQMGIGERSLAEWLSYEGKAEPRDAANGRLDILLTDGFTGNVYLKNAEATALLVNEAIKNAGRGIGIWEKLALLPGLPVMLKLRSLVHSAIHPAQYSGAIMLGYNGAVVKGHGISTADEIYHGINRTIRYVKCKCNDAVTHALRRYLI